MVSHGTPVAPKPCNIGSTVNTVLRAQRQVDPKDLLALLQVQWEIMSETIRERSDGGKQCDTNLWPSYVCDWVSTQLPHTKCMAKDGGGRGNFRGDECG